MWLTRLYERFRHLVHELGKFGIVGAVAYVVDTGLFGLLLAVGVESLTAKIIAAVIAATVAFVGNRFWTWRHRERSGLAREYMLYFALNGVGLAISLAFLGVSHYVLGAFWPVFQSPLADLVAANVIGLGAGTTFRFWSYRRFVFREVTNGSEKLSREVTNGSDKLGREVTSGEPAAESAPAAEAREARAVAPEARSADPRTYDDSLAPATPAGPARRSDVA